jgi:hypothetical protein
VHLEVARFVCTVLPRLINGMRAGLKRCRVIHGGGCCLQQTHAAVNNSGHTQELHSMQPPQIEADHYAKLALVNPKLKCPHFCGVGALNTRS